MLTADQRIAKYIILSQIASDAGKGIYELLPNGDAETTEARKGQYAAKDKNILSAIKMICRNKTKAFRFYVTRDVEKKAKYIVYFDCKIENKYIQISFHSFNNALDKFLNGSKASKTSWDFGSSRENCKKLSEYYKL